MTHFVHIPSPPLDRFVSAFIYYKGYVTTHSIDRYLPNGNTEILLNLAETPRYVYDNETLTPLQACKKVWVSGIREHFISIPSGTDAEMFIIEFKRGMAYPFLYHPLSEITDKVVEINGIFTEMRERLLEKATVAGKFLTAEQMLCGRFGERMIVNPFIDFAVNRIQNDPGGLTIKKIADKTGYSSKHLIRLFSDHVGVTPKSFLRIIRFQKAIREIEAGQRINWAGLASDCGFYDQAHFIRNFKAFSGFTPLEYVRQRNGDFPDYVPVG